MRKFILRRQLNLPRGILSGAFQLTIATALSQGINFIIAPLLTRLCGPALFGSFGTYSGFVNALGAAPNGKLEQAILIEDSDERRETLSQACIWFCAFTSFLMLIVGLVSYGFIEKRYGQGLALASVIAGPIFILSNGLWFLYQFENVAAERFLAIGRTQIIRAALAGLAQVVAAAAGFGIIGLALGQSIFQLISLPPWFLVRVMKLSAGAGIRRRILEVRDVVVSYRSFILFGTPQSVLNGFSNSLPVIVFGAMFGTQVAGFFWLVYRVISLPNQLLIESVRTVLYKRLSLCRYDGRHRREIFVTSVIIVALMVPLAIALIVAGPWLFETIFGPRWRTSGVYAQVIAIGWVFQNAMVPSTTWLVIAQRQGVYLMIEIVAMIFRVVVIGLGAVQHSTAFALGGLAVVAAAQCTLLMALALGTKTKRSSE